MIELYGAVSEEVCLAMTGGLKQRTGADYALAITGVAGPGGGTKEKPVGMVFIGICAPEGIECLKFTFAGDRGQVRRRSAVKAAELLFRTLTAENL